MIWKKHYTKSEHAFLGASKYSWINYNEKKLRESWQTYQAAKVGTELHAFAAKAIELGISMERNGATLNRYVNDALGFRLKPEVLLYYSENCFGTADAIGYDEKKKFLRIHDLKTGKIPAKMDQLKIYAALFCLDYEIKPGDIDCELRIYQNDDVQIYEPTTDEILHIMGKIISFDKIIQKIKVMEG